MFLTVSRPKRRWSQLDRSQLTSLAAEGVPTRVIARRLGRTPLAVRLMAFRSRIRLGAPRPRGNVARLRAFASETAMSGFRPSTNRADTTSHEPGVRSPSAGLGSIEASIARMAARYRFTPEGTLGALSAASAGA